MNRLKRLARTALVVGTVGLTLTGCLVESGRPEQSRSIGGATACPVDPDPTVTGTVRIGWQEIPNGDLIVKDTGLLKTCLPNVNVVWSKFASGGDVIQAFGANSLDVGLLGSAPAAKALSAPLNIDMKVIWIQDRIGAAESLVAKDPAIRTVADLKGKRIAVPFASTAHYSLLTALDKAGVTDARVINLAPDAIRGAWGGGQIDATYIWEPTLSQLGGTVLTDSAKVAEQGAPTYDLEGARGDFVKNNPAFLKAWTAAQGWAANLLNTDPNKAAEHIAGQLGVPLDQVLTQVKGYAYFDAKTQGGADHLGGQLGADLRRTAEFLLQQGQVQGVAPAQHYTDGVYATAAQGVSK
ncbi:glycine/betaine ABC transporter substrate-binding protein [Tsukamurella pulmonis]|uniref:taurine ABC transporter substrate-binding protein n=1 Tax=Tsukamurella pulmonis TaxID=47312 RepID=UPI000797EFFD|nr:ABC transporter substrate-binding protein [Tsukamurella pulmonis]KXP11050.1 glycine/betaine ABC transporter substrate-binding protein [Tsukamurella pulmonis]RDH11106.1 glycine/betaine ABC transporter substrate-binding protein [Tsukamurella pulmonis]BDD83823.1 glycine/betaine ABC transporter substrate-binding protein [Tsukamurella pulmonis]